MAKFLPQGGSIPPAVLLPAAVVVLAAGLFSLPNYHILLPPDSFLAKFLTHPSLLFLGFAGLVYLFRALPESTTGSPHELSRLQAYPWFALFFALCFAGRFYHPEEFPPYYFVDMVITTGDIRTMVDLKQHPLILALGSRPTFFPYLTSTLWGIFPNASGTWICRLSSALIDLGLIWGLYLLGRTLRGRRMGLILMSFWALSMPGCFWAYSGYGINETILVCVWALVFFYRILQGPTLARFLYLGATLASGAYVVDYLRPLTPSIITLVLVWILFGSKDKPKGAWAWVLAGGLWVSWAFLFFYKNNFLPKGSWVQLFTNPLFLVALAALLAVAFMKTRATAAKNETHRRLTAWAASAALTALLMAPMLMNNLYSDYVTYISVLHSTGKLGMALEELKYLWGNVVYGFQILFTVSQPDFSNYPVRGHSFFESYTQMGLFVGLAYFLARPAWRKYFLFLIVGVGMVPFVMSERTHSGRLLVSVAPILLMAAWGCDVLWEIFTREMKNPNGVRTAFLLVVAFWAWDARQTYAVSREWMAYRTTNDAVIGAQVNQDWQDHRLILAKCPPNFMGPNFPPLCDQKDAWVLRSPHPIDLEPGETSKDIALLVYTGDKATLDKVRADFPLSQPTTIDSLNGHFMERFLIPFNNLEEKPGKMIYIERVAHDTWRRRFYWADYPYGIARGDIGWDERVADLKAPFPAGMNEWVTARAEGEMTVPSAGDYTLTSTLWGNDILLSIDGKEVDLRPSAGGQERRGKIHLEAGKHRVSYATDFKGSRAFQDILITPPAGVKGWVLGQPALNSQP